MVIAHLIQCISLLQLGFVWIVRQKEFAKNLAKLSEGDKPTTSTLKVLAKAASEKKEEKRLSKDDLSWSGYLEKLRAFKAQSGHLRVPFADNRPRKNPHPRAAADDETIQLGKWVKRQRRAHSQGKLSQERVEALEEIGFSFKPGNATKEEKIEIQLGLVRLHLRLLLLFFSSRLSLTSTFCHCSWTISGSDGS